MGNSANVVLNASAPIANVNVAANAQLKNASPALIADANLLAIAKLDAHALLKAPNAVLIASATNVSANAAVNVQPKVANAVIASASPLAHANNRCSCTCPCRINCFFSV